MLAKTHILIAAALGLALQLKPVFIAAAALAAVLPDLDHRFGWLNKKLLIGKPIAFAFKHRGLWHSLWLCLLVWAAGLAVSKPFANAAALGWASHLAADALTKEGIAPLAPIAFKISGPIKTGSIAESAISLALLATIGLLIVF